MTDDSTGSADRTDLTYVLIPGAGGGVEYWSLVVDELSERGATAIAVELPTGDETAGLAEYAAAVVAAARDRGRLVLVAQSMGAFTAPLVCDRLPVGLIVLVNAMVPTPGESAGDWWTATEQGQARADQAARDGRSLDDEDLMLDVFFHDVPPAITAQAMAAGEQAQAEKPFGEPWPLAAWPDVPTRALVGADDRLFPAEFQHRVLLERLSMTADEMPGGHLVALSQPSELADRLLAYASEVVAAS